MVVVSYDPRWKRHSDTDAADDDDDDSSFSLSLSLSRILYRYLLFICMCSDNSRKVTISNNDGKQRVYRSTVVFGLYRYRIDSWPKLLSASSIHKDEKAKCVNGAWTDTKQTFRF